VGGFSVRQLAAGMATSGTITTWLQELMGGVPFETLVSEAAAVLAGNEGLVMLPLRHGRGHLLRAAYDGIACG
jgi:xylulokinase